MNDYDELVDFVREGFPGYAETVDRAMLELETALALVIRSEYENWLFENDPEITSYLMGEEVPSDANAVRAISKLMWTVMKAICDSEGIDWETGKPLDG